MNNTLNTQSVYNEGENMNINLGTTYEVIIERIIAKGIAGNQTDVIRQALLAYERAIDEN